MLIDIKPPKETSQGVAYVNFIFRMAYIEILMPTGVYETLIG